MTILNPQDNNRQIALIEIDVTSKKIDHATIVSIEDVVVNAQFRVIPHLIVDGKVLLDTVCDFDYKWTSNDNVKIQGNNKRRLGVNATAVK